jgi:hypothetical protein
MPMDKKTKKLGTLIAAWMPICMVLWMTLIQSTKSSGGIIYDAEGMAIMTKIRQEMKRQGCRLSHAMEKYVLFSRRSRVFITEDAVHIAVPSVGNSKKIKMFIDVNTYRSSLVDEKYNLLDFLDAAFKKGK